MDLGRQAEELDGIRLTPTRSPEAARIDPEQRTAGGNLRGWRDEMAKIVLSTYEAKAANTPGRFSIVMNIGQFFYYRHKLQKLQQSEKPKSDGGIERL